MIKEILSSIFTGSQGCGCNSDAITKITYPEANPLCELIYDEKSEQIPAKLPFFSDQINKSGPWGLTPLLLACSRKVSFDIIKALIDNGADVNARSGQNDTPLINACRASQFNTSFCRRNNLDVVNLLLEKGADANAENDYNQTALYHACRCCCPEIAQRLIEHGAELKSWLLVVCGDHEVVGTDPYRVTTAKVLIAHGADVNVRSGKGSTPLILACGLPDDQVELVKLLIDRGADTAVTNDNGFTPLMRAAERNNFGIVKLLLESRNKPLSQAEMMSVMMIAATKGNPGII